MKAALYLRLSLTDSQRQGDKEEDEEGGMEIEEQFDLPAAGPSGLQFAAAEEEEEENENMEEVFEVFV